MSPRNRPPATETRTAGTVSRGEERYADGAKTTSHPTNKQLQRTLYPGFVGFCLSSAVLAIHVGLHSVPHWVTHPAVAFNIFFFTAFLHYWLTGFPADPRGAIAAAGKACAFSVESGREVWRSVSKERSESAISVNVVNDGGAACAAVEADKAVLNGSGNLVSQERTAAAAETTGGGALRTTKDEKTAEVHTVYAHPSWLAGFMSAFPFYISREVRDREKLGYWDWPGLLAPLIGLVLLYGSIEAFLWWRRMQEMKRLSVT